MPSKSAASESRRTPGRRRRRFKRRELRLADGGSLVLNPDGSIDHVADDGTAKHSWSPDDADWPRQAFRFGLHPQGATVPPHDGRGWETLPPRR